jgi:transcriptional regulator with XRE-family HTH domain
LIYGLTVETQSGDRGAWARTIARDVGERVRIRRRELNLSAQTVSDRTGILGHEIKRSVIAEMENGNRSTVSIADVLMLAQALNMPPMMLLFPVGTTTLTEIRPGELIEAWQAADWFAGLDELPLDKPWSEYSRDDDDEWEAVREPLAMRIEYDKIVTEIRSIDRQMRRRFDEARASDPGSAARGWAAGTLDGLLWRRDQAMEDYLRYLSLAREREWTEPSESLTVDDRLETTVREWLAVERGPADTESASSRA